MENPNPQDKKPNSKDETIDLAFNRGDSLRLISLFGGYRHSLIDKRNQMLELGNPAIILLLAYLLTLPGIILEFFMFKHFWYFGFDIYSLYIFFLSTGCVITGIYLIFRRADHGSGSSLYIRNFPLFASSAFLAFVSIFLLLIFGQESVELAILFSVFIVAAIIMSVASAKNMATEDLLPYALYGIGAVIVALVPVHQAFGIWGGIPGTFQFTVFDGTLVVIGVTISLISLNAIRNRTGFLSAWLVGATLIALISFHELASITASGSFEIYDQILALEGAIYSLVPLALYFVNEYRSAKLWTHIVNAKRSLDKKNYDRAVKNGEKAMDLLSDSGFSNRVSLPWSMNGDIFYKMGKLNRAKTLYDIALQIDPNDYETWSNLGNMYVIKGYGEQALEAYLKAAKIKPNDARIWSNVGVVHLSLKRYEDAIKAFRKAIEIDPNFTTAIYNLGIILLRLGKPAAAMKHFKQLMMLAPKDESFRKAYDRTALLLHYFQQAAGWKMLGLDVSDIVRTVVEKSSRFEEEYKGFLSDIISRLHKKTFKGNKNRTAEALFRLLEKLGNDGMDIMKLKENPGMTPDQLRYSIAILALTDRIQFKTIENEIRLLPMDKTVPELKDFSRSRFGKGRAFSKKSSAS